MGTQRHNAREIINCIVALTVLWTQRENDVAPMKSQEQRRRRITEKVSKEIEELSKFSEPNTCLIFSYNSSRTWVWMIVLKTFCQMIQI